MKFNTAGFPLSLNEDYSEVWKDLSSLPSVASINKDVRYIDSIIRQHPRLLKFSEKGNIYISAHLSEGSKINFLFTLPLPAGIKEKEIERIIESYSGKNQLVLRRR